MTCKPSASATKPLPKPFNSRAEAMGVDTVQNAYRAVFRSSGLEAVVGALSALFGMAGALLLAMPQFPAWGFGAFLVSNLGWLLFSAANRHWTLFVQQLVFLASSLLGLWNWWLGPLLAGA
jgi:hypothetical protein